MAQVSTGRRVAVARQVADGGILSVLTAPVRVALWWLGPFPGTVPRPASLQIPGNRESAVDDIHVACAADENYAPHCAAMLHSVFCHANGLRVVVHFMHARGMTTDPIERLREVVENNGGNFDPVAVEESMVQGLFSTEYITQAAWYRSLLPLLRPDIDRVLYLDCDVLAVDSLRNLWETDIEHCYVAAVRNVFEPRLETRHHELGIPPDQAYFNTGVLLMNLALIRRDGCVERILEHGHRHGSRLIWVEQDSVNAVLGTKCRLLHPRWNCQNSLFYWRRAAEVFGDEVLSEATRRPAILHFEGPGLAKPWNYLCKHPYRSYYYAHLAQTPWRHLPPENLDWWNRLLRLLPMRITPEVIDLLRRLKRFLAKTRARLTRP